jgi:hypothetical protein
MSEAADAGVDLQGIRSVAPGDQVDVTAHHDYASPLDVVDVDGPTEWDVPLGEDWFTAVLRVETSRGTVYEIGIDSGRDEAATFYAHDDGERGIRYGAVEQLTIVDAEGDSPNQDPPTDGTASDVDDETDQSLEAVDIDEPGADDRDDQDEDQDDGDEGVALPAGVTEDDVHTAVDEEEYLNLIAEELGVPETRARSIVHSLGRYPDVSEATRYRGGVAREQ